MVAIIFSPTVLCFFFANLILILLFCYFVNFLSGGLSDALSILLSEYKLCHTNCMQTVLPWYELSGALSTLLSEYKICDTHRKRRVSLQYALSNVLSICPFEVAYWISLNF